MQNILTIVGFFLFAFWNLYIHYRQKKIESDFKKNEFIHKLQFEKEFAIYVALWNAVIDLDRYTLQLYKESRRKKFSIGDSPTNIFDDYDNALFNEMKDKGLKILDLLEKDKPFYDIKVYSVIEKLIFNLKNEINALELNQPENSINAEQNRDFIKIKDELCNAIRKRTAYFP